METGQSFMQISAKTMVDFARPLTTAAPSTAVVKKDSQPFAVILRETSPKSSSRPEQAARHEVKREIAQKVEKLDESAKDQPEARLADDSDANDRVSGKNDPAKESLVNEQKKEKSAVQPEVLMPQNVELSATEVQSVIVQQLSEGRMPQSVNSEDCLNMVTEKVESQNAADASIVTMLPNERLPAVTVGQAQEITPYVNIPAKEPDADKMEAVSQQQAAAQVVVKMKTVSFQPAAENKQPVQQVDVPLREFSPAELTANQGVKVPTGLSDSEKLAEVKPADVQAAEVQPALIQKTDAEQMQPVAKAEIARLIPDSRPQALNAIPVTPSVAPENAAQQSSVATLQQAEKVQVQATTQEFRFARSAAVDVAVGVGNEVIDQPKGKGDVLPAFEARITDSGKTVEAAPSGFNGSESGFNGNSGEGFSQQNLEMPKPGTMQTANAPLTGAANITAVSSSPAATQEQVRTVSSESIAGQVKEQLSSRNIKPGTEQITIQLSPDHLGDIKVSFRLDDQRLRVEIVAENRHARESLLQHADSLKESLARQNINMEKFEVTGGNNGNANQGGNSQSEWREMAKNRQSQQWLTSGGYRTQSLDAEAAAPVYFARAEHSTLDLHF